MKHLKSFSILVLLIISVFSLQLERVEATPTTQIVSATSIDCWGNINNVIYRGLQTSVVIVLNSQINGNFQVCASLFDTCNTPVAYTAGNFELQSGNNTITLFLKASAFAFVGSGKLHIVVSESNYTPVASLDTPVYIDILSDFNQDKKVDFQDMTIFANAYIDYRQNYTLPSNDKCCDITGDNKINFEDLAAFATGYIIYSSTK